MFDRTGGQRSMRSVQTSAVKVFRAPYRGYIKAENQTAPRDGGAVLMDNWFPTTEGARMRKGSQTRATLAGGVTHLAVFDPSAKFFATDTGNIYDISTVADADEPPEPVVTGLTSGDWSSLEFRAAGSNYLVMVNGADSLRLYNGSAWATITGVSSPIAITGVTTADLSHVWKFKNRLFFVKVGTMSAWYLGALSIGGAASELPLGGVFSLGGSLMFGASWSVDSGSGLDDLCLFITDKGECAVYQGSNPADADDWSLVGVYRIGEPLHKNAHFRAGGDVAVLTRDGIIPISAAMTTDRSGLKMKSVTAPIEEAWRKYVDARGNAAVPFSCIMWHAQSMLLVGLPQGDAIDRRVLVANARTGAWSSGFTGWYASCFAVYNDSLYFGTPLGKVKQAEVGGTDDGTPYQCTVVASFDAFNSPVEKMALHARAVIKTDLPFSLTLFASSDYAVEPPAAVSADSFASGNLWDVALWDVGVWGSGKPDKAAFTNWQTVNGVGHALAPGLSITSGNTAAPDVELINLQLVYQSGQVMG